MKRSKLILLLAALVLLAVSATLFIYSRSITNTYSMYSEVIVKPGNSAGIALDRGDIIRFGVVQPGGSAERKFHIQSGEKRFVQIKLTGNLSTYVTASDNNFVLIPNETKTVTLTAEVPENAPEGNYSGYVHVLFFHPWFR